MAAAAVATPSNGVHSTRDNIVHANLNYYLDPSKGGRDEFAIGTAGAYRRKFDSRPVDIRDARGYENDFDIDIHGFQYHKRPCTEKHFTDDAQVKTVAYTETAQLLKDLTGATDVHVFSHIVRRNDPAQVQAALKSDLKSSDDTTPVAGIFPASYIHIDQTPACALQLLKDSFDDDSRLGRHVLENGGRWGIINVWRPISPIKRDPLALCDARSIEDEYLQPIRVLQPPKDRPTQYATTTKGEYVELYYARYSEGQKWYYVSDMDTDEVLLIKCFDSTTNPKMSRRCPHSAFEWRDNLTSGSPRESIEIRCLVFWEDQKS